ncbi:CD1247 N-terminal domain-containing protein [Acetonema longum]|uniref:AraC family transcriptional regulator n=1 Tax=Acetonema longum DSM 6540 TaxID=1009370 RepID=F7NI78_9FIRM|nr:CD1247 N-terminal domain-containing protein [Acetonema longum]EGO64243.1 hypothetical protein ALO_08882 [Acetonema longum DSM 6540]
MGNVKEKVAYLQGLTKGLNVSGESSEGKILLNMIDVLESLAQEIHLLSHDHQELQDYVETIDEDLHDLEETVYEDEPADEPIVEVECPRCHETVTFGADNLEDEDVIEITCPTCGEVVYENTYDTDADDLIAVESKPRNINAGI